MAQVAPVTITNLTQASDITRVLQPFLTQVYTAFRGQVTTQDNIRCSIVSVTFPSTANQNVQVSHGLNATPVGYLPIVLSGACSIYSGNSPVLGATFVNLKCNTASIVASVLFF
jgi:hypothetical protein